MIDISFTGEYFVPGMSGERLESDHMERYYFACRYAFNKTVLDIGCGVGYSAPFFIQAGAASYEGVDLNKNLIEYARHKYSSSLSNFYVGDICTFNRGEKYDLITCYETIEHVKHYKAALRNVFTLLNPHGLLIISSPNRILTSPGAIHFSDKPNNKFHMQEFTIGEFLKELREAGFLVESNNVYGQRQRRYYKSKLVRLILRAILGNPDTKTAPEVTVIKDKMPRFIVVVAVKQ